MARRFVCITEVTRNPHNIDVKIHKGDVVHLLNEGEANDPFYTINGGNIGYVFHEHPGIVYDPFLFVEIPPDKEKTIYVCMDRRITRQTEKLIMN